MRKWHISGLFPPVFGTEQCMFCSVRCSNGNFGCLELILVGGGQIYYDATNRVWSQLLHCNYKIGCESLKLYLLDAKKKTTQKSLIYIKLSLVPLEVLSVIVYIASILNLTWSCWQSIFMLLSSPCPNCDSVLKWLSHSFLEKLYLFVLGWISELVLKLQ